MGVLDWITGNVAPDPKTPYRSAGELAQALLSLSRDDAPWDVRTGEDLRCDLVAEWKIVDARWYDFFGKAGMKRSFRMLMRLDAATRNVRSVDQDGTVEWHAGVPTTSFQTSKFRGKEMSIDIGAGFGIKEDGTVGKTYGYRFDTAEIKAPVKQVVAAHGWGWRSVSFGTL